MDETTRRRRRAVRPAKGVRATAGKGLPKRRYDPEEARADIVRAAREVLLSEGYAGASLRKVAELAGVPHSLVSYHFGGKEGLTESVIDDLYGWIGPFTTSYLAGRAADAATLGALVAGGVAALAEHPETARSRLGREVRESDRLRRRVVELLRPAFEEAVAFVRRGIEAGSIRTTDPDVAVSFAVAAVRAYFEDGAFYGELAQRDLSAPGARAALTEMLFGLVGWLCAPSRGA